MKKNTAKLHRSLLGGAILMALVGGLMNGPLDENASAEATAISRPVVLTRLGAAVRTRVAVTVMSSACHECRRLHW